MASPNQPHVPPPVNQDTLITLKIFIDGNNRKFKLALRDLGAHILPQKVCLFMSSESLFSPNRRKRKSFSSYIFFQLLSILILSSASVPPCYSSRSSSPLRTFLRLRCCLHTARQRQPDRLQAALSCRKGEIEAPYESHYYLTRIPEDGAGH